MSWSTHRCAALALLAFACDAPGHVTAPVVGGARELGEPAVAYVSYARFAGSCTATLIAPTVVLTAKHCVMAAGADTPFPASEIIVGTGDRVATLRQHRVRHVETTEGAGLDNNMDIALLVLEEPITDIEPIPIRTDRPDDMVGQTFTAVGFGTRPDMGYGVKYTTTGTVESITAGMLRTTSVACLGDSGGPMIQEMPQRRVVGVATVEQYLSNGERCPGVANLYDGLWNHVAMIHRAFVIAGECLGVEEACNGLDDDCDGELDEGCAPLGAPCSTDQECAFAQADFLPPSDGAVRCEDVGGASICTVACDPLRPLTGCSVIERPGVTEIEGLYCRRTDACEGRCAPGVPGAAADGESCTADTECQSLACADPGDGVRRCVPPCRGGAGSCPVGEACAAGAGGCGYCVDADIVRAPRQLGEPCGDGGRCTDGSTCEDDPNGAYCTHPCASDDECGSFRCEDGRCVRGARSALGDPCQDLDECAAGSFCAARDERQWCSHECTESAECPDGFECASAEPRFCAPTGSLLGQPCASGGECAAGVCEDGVCTRACSADNACPAGFACLRDARGAARCLTRPPSGGCSAAPGGDLPVGLFAPLLALALARSRRRSRRALRHVSHGGRSANEHRSA